MRRIKILAAILAMFAALLFTSPRAARADAVLPTNPPPKCLRLDCWYYEPYNIAGVGSSEGGWECEWAVNDCRGWGEIPILFQY